MKTARPNPMTKKKLTTSRLETRLALTHPVFQKGANQEILRHLLLMNVLQILHLTQRQENAIRFWDLVLMERREESLDIVQ
jgi:hypothetical protein